MGDWMRSAQRAAATEFGRRNYKTFAAVEITKRVVPTLAVGAMVGGVCWLGWKAWHWLTVPSHQPTHVVAPSWDVGWVSAALPWAVVALLVAATVGVLVWAARRYMWLVDVFLPLEYGAAWVAVVGVVFLAGAGGAVWWAVT